MILSVRSARARYRSDLAAKKISDEKASKKRKVTEESSQLKEKRMKLTKEITNFEKDANNLSLVAESKGCLTTLSKANALRRSIEEKKKQLILLDNGAKSLIMN